MKIVLAGGNQLIPFRWLVEALLPGISTLGPISGSQWNSSFSVRALLLGRISSSLIQRSKKRLA